MGIALYTAAHRTGHSNPVGCCIRSSSNRRKVSISLRQNQYMMQVLSIGWNAVPRGLENAGLPDQSRFALHAECNALVFADRSLLPGSTLYVTQFPCLHCALQIIQVASFIGQIASYIGSSICCVLLGLRSAWSEIPYRVSHFVSRVVEGQNHSVVSSSLLLAFISYQATPPMLCQSGSHTQRTGTSPRNKKFAKQTDVWRGSWMVWFFNGSWGPTKIKKISGTLHCAPHHLCWLAPRRGRSCIQSTCFPHGDSIRFVHA